GDVGVADRAGFVSLCAEYRVARAAVCAAAPAAVRAGGWDAAASPTACATKVGRLTTQCHSFFPKLRIPHKLWGGPAVGTTISASCKARAGRRGRRPRRGPQDRGVRPTLTETHPRRLYHNRSNHGRLCVDRTIRQGPPFRRAQPAPGAGVYGHRD